MSSFFLGFAVVVLTLDVFAAPDTAEAETGANVNADAEAEAGTGTVTAAKAVGTDLVGPADTVLLLAALTLFLAL